MGDIISLVDSIQEDYLPPIPLRYKNLDPLPLEPKIGKKHCLSMLFRFKRHFKYICFCKNTKERFTVHLTAVTLLLLLIIYIRGATNALMNIRNC